MRILEIHSFVFACFAVPFMKTSGQLSASFPILEGQTAFQSPPGKDPTPQISLPPQTPTPHQYQYQHLQEQPSHLQQTTAEQITWAPDTGDRWATAAAPKTEPSGFFPRLPSLEDLSIRRHQHGPGGPQHTIPSMTQSTGYSGDIAEQSQNQPQQTMWVTPIPSTSLQGLFLGGDHPTGSSQYHAGGPSGTYSPNQMKQSDHGGIANRERLGRPPGSENRYGNHQQGLQLPTMPSESNLFQQQNAQTGLNQNTGELNHLVNHQADRDRVESEASLQNYNNQQWQSKPGHNHGQLHDIWGQTTVHQSQQHSPTQFGSTSGVPSHGDIGGAHLQEHGHGAPTWRGQYYGQSDQWVSATSPRSWGSDGHGLASWNKSENRAVYGSNTGDMGRSDGYGPMATVNDTQQMHLQKSMQSSGSAYWETYYTAREGFIDDFDYRDLDVAVPEPYNEDNEKPEPKSLRGDDAGRMMEFAGHYHRRAVNPHYTNGIESPPMRPSSSSATQVAFLVVYRLVLHLSSTC